MFATRLVTTRTLQVGAMTSVFWLGTSSASAEPATLGRAEALVSVGYGISEDAHEEYGPALGVQGGYTFESALHLGLRFQHFFGTAPSRERETSIDLIEFVPGYDVAVSRTLVFRPVFGMGATRVLNPLEHEGSDYVFFHVAPGLSLVKTFGSLAAVFDFRYSVPNTRVNLEDALVFGIGFGGSVF